MFKQRRAREGVEFALVPGFLLHRADHSRFAQCERGSKNTCFDFRT